MFLSVFPQNNCCILNDLSICIIVNCVQVQDNPYLIVKKFTNVENFYDVGIDSAFVGIYKCNKLSDNIYIVPLLNVMNKCYVVPFWQNTESFICWNVHGRWEFTGEGASPRSIKKITKFECVVTTKTNSK